MAAKIDIPSLKEEYPPQVDLREMMAQNPLPVIAPGTINPDSMAGEEPTKQALTVLRAFNNALAADDAKALERCFFTKQAYWKDQLALTYHLRTFSNPAVIAANCLETKRLRNIIGEVKLEGEAQFILATPVLQFIGCGLSFKTNIPAATCSGSMLLLPVKNALENETIEWKIWILTTKLENLDLQPEDEALLQSPGRQLDGLETLETDVFIIGGGNAAAALSARLKALGVESVMAERNARPGDNWALRYDCLQFHLPASFCELPYLPYDKELQTPHLLSKNELAEHMRRYVAAFHLNMITSAKIQSTIYDQSARRWTVKFQTPSGLHTVVSKHLVQATGLGSQKPYLPPIADSHLYKGISVHSAEYKSATQLREQGVKSILIIGSANTAFDVLEDCNAAGLQTTMVVRSPTYLLPVEYVFDKHSLGVYDLGVEAADRRFMTMPTCVASQLSRGLFAAFASKEPGRYSALAATGFPVIDSLQPDASLMHHLLERSGGHYVDVGATKLLVEGKAGVKAGVEPVAYTATGLRFSDNSTLDANAVVWCTGYADKDVRATAAEILGGGNTAAKTNEEDDGDKNLLGSGEIAARLDATWGVDAEGEIRGVWKRHLRLDNYWVTGGDTQKHRWYSRVLALQIKAALEGILPEAYRETKGI